MGFHLGHIWPGRTCLWYPEIERLNDVYRPDQGDPFVVPSLSIFHLARGQLFEKLTDPDEKLGGPEVCHLLCVTDDLCHLGVICGHVCFYLSS